MTESLLAAIYTGIYLLWSPISCFPAKNKNRATKWRFCCFLRFLHYLDSWRAIFFENLFCSSFLLLLTLFDCMSLDMKRNIQMIENNKYIWGNQYDYEMLFLLKCFQSTEILIGHKTMKWSNKIYEKFDQIAECSVNHSFFPSDSWQLVRNLIVNNIVSIWNQFCIIFSNRPCMSRLSGIYVRARLFCILLFVFIASFYIMSFVNTKYSSDAILWWSLQLLHHATADIFFFQSHYLFILNVKIFISCREYATTRTTGRDSDEYILGFTILCVKNGWPMSFFASLISVNWSKSECDTCAACTLRCTSYRT